MNDKNYKELSSSYKTTEHFKDRLRERFNVFNNQLPWAQTFFNSKPNLISDVENVQKWSNGNIVIVVNVKERSYITAYAVSNGVVLDELTYNEFKSLSARLIKNKKHATLKNIQALKKVLVVKMGEPDDSLETLNQTNQKISDELKSLQDFENSIGNYLEIVTVEKEND